MEALLYESVLVLNKDFLAIAVIPARDAITALANEKAKVITESYETYDLKEWGKITHRFKDDEEFKGKYAGILRSPSLSLFVPQVVIFLESDYTAPKEVSMRYSRRNIYQRDNCTCQYCGIRPKKDEMNLDHVIPKSRGGKNSWKNVVTSCIYCNAKKGDKLLSEIGWKLIQEPKEPKWRSHMGIPFNKHKRSYWENFLR